MQFVYNSEAGELYSKKLAKFVGKCLKSERVTSVSIIYCIDSNSAFSLEIQCSNKVDAWKLSFYTYGLGIVF